jgi:hypothetical protein
MFEAGFGIAPDRIGKLRALEYGREPLNGSRHSGTSERSLTEPFFTFRI